MVKLKIRVKAPPPKILERNIRTTKGIKTKLDKTVDTGHIVNKTINKFNKHIPENQTHSRPEEYATDNITEKSEYAIRKLGAKTAEETKKIADKGYDKIREYNKVKQHNRYDKHFKEDVQKQSHVKAQSQSRVYPQNQAKNNSPIIKTRETKSQVQKSPYYKNRPYSTSSKVLNNQSGKNTIKSAINTGNKTNVPIKTTSKTVKVSRKTIKSTNKGIKTSSKVVKNTAITSKKTIQAARKATFLAKKTAITTAKAAKVSVKAIIVAVKTTITAIKGLAATIAGGWIAVLIVVIIGVIALMLSSPWGIFFSSEDNADYIPMNEIVMEFNEEYNSELEAIRNGIDHDEIEMTGIRATWKDILAFYSILTTTNEENPEEVALITEEKKEELHDIFWEMNSIAYKTETIEEIEMQPAFDDLGNPVIDDSGNPVEDEVIIEIIILHIKISSKNASYMASHYDFNEDQIDLLEQILLPEINSMWTTVLYGISSSDTAIVAVALSQVGNVNGDPYWSWYGFTYRVEWCACFVSWCANEIGYIEAGVIPKFAGTEYSGKPWFRANGLWQDNSFTPTPGSIIFFDWNGDGMAQHVGIVEKVEDGYVYTIEGNADNSCKQKRYPLGSSKINGYGTPQY